MHAGLFDVFHDAANHHIVAVGDGVHVHFGRFFQELIDQHGTRRTHQRRLRHIFLNGIQIVGDHHGAPAQNVTRAHQDREANIRGDPRGFFRHQRRTIFRLRNF